MKRKLKQFILILLPSLIDLLLIAAQIFIITSSFNWSNSCDPENLLGLLILIANPVTLLFLLILIIINFIVKENRKNAKMLLVSICNYILFILALNITFSHFLSSSYFFAIYHTILTLNIVIYALAAITTVVNTIKCFSNINAK
ncbi:MAG: hypothetical protein Q8936_10850 [Bacillota bacterium]|nr:hypothetical protein [Bacillota bacterium]